MSKQPQPAPTASAIRPCPTIIQISMTPRLWKFTQHLRTTPKQHPEINTILERERPDFCWYKKAVTLDQLIQGVKDDVLLEDVECDIEVPQSWRKGYEHISSLPDQEYFWEMSPIFCTSEIPFEVIGGWSGGAMVLGKLPVPGRPTLWIIVGQGPTVLAVGAGGGCLDIFTLIYPFSSLSPSLWETARYRLQYCLKGPLNPKQPTNQPIEVIASLMQKYAENAV